MIANFVLLVTCRGKFFNFLIRFIIIAIVYAKTIFAVIQLQTIARTVTESPLSRHWNIQNIPVFFKEINSYLKSSRFIRIEILQWLIVIKFTLKLVKNLRSNCNLLCDYKLILLYFQFKLVEIWLNELRYESFPVCNGLL